jgi:demethylspheroidene O-methyltransferase
VLAWRDRLVARPAFQRWAATFPLTRPVARRRAHALFDLCAGFVYSQTLAACLRLDLFAMLAGRPQDAAAVALRTGLSLDATERLLSAATALRLLERRGGGRYGLGPLGAPLVGNVGLGALVEHHALLYDDLRDPVALLRAGQGAGVAGYFPYATDAAPQQMAPDRVSPYTALMAATVAPIAEELLDAYPLGAHRCVMDVGGGEGAFAAIALRRHPRLRAMLYDLPPVVAIAEARLAEAGVADRVAMHAGNFRSDQLPEGADVITLVRVLLDHDDAAVLDLVRRVRAALPRGGVLVVAEPMAGERHPQMAGDVYFAMYLLAMGGGRARRPSELRALLHQGGFTKTRQLATRYAVHTGVIIATA